MKNYSSIQQSLINIFKVKEYYGSIDVESEEDKGTVFHIYLPAASFFS